MLREDGDNTPDQELKRAWLHAYGKERILFTVDDRQKVVDMWREEGLTCLQCADWKEGPRLNHDERDVLAWASSLRWYDLREDDALIFKRIKSMAAALERLAGAERHEEN